MCADGCGTSPYAAASSLAPRGKSLLTGTRTSLAFPEQMAWLGLMDTAAPAASCDCLFSLATRGLVSTFAVIPGGLWATKTLTTPWLSWFCVPLVSSAHLFGMGGVLLYDNIGPFVKHDRYRKIGGNMHRQLKRQRDEHTGGCKLVNGRYSPTTEDAARHNDNESIQSTV